MALDWKPHSNPPPDRLATVLVAYAPELGVDNGYVGRMYEVRFGVIRCEHYVEGCYRRNAEVWPRFSLLKLLEDPQFLTAGEA